MWIALASMLSGTASAQDDEIDRLRSFAKLYGMVRWFHPADEMQEIDLDSLACAGVARARSASDLDELQRSLAGLFDPIAPTVQVWTDHAPDRPRPSPGVRVDDSVAWRHVGLGNAWSNGPYVSARTGELATVARAGDRIGWVVWEQAAAGLAGRTVRLSAMARSTPRSEGGPGLWVRGMAPDAHTTGSATTLDHPYGSAGWGAVELEFEVPADTTSVRFGAFLQGHGVAWVDDVRMDVREEQGWTTVPLDGAFERRRRPWTTSGEGFSFRVVRTDEAPQGRRALRMERRMRTVPTRFDHDAVGPNAEVAGTLHGGLQYRVPLSVPRLRSGSTWPEATPDSLQAELQAAPCDNPEDADTRIASVVVAWNVFQHFYPYFDVVDADWDAVLTSALTEARDSDTGADMVGVLERMIVPLADGHGSVRHPRYPRAWLPVALAWVEDRLVVTGSEVDGASAGDIVLAVDGVTAADRMRSASAQVSGSPQWRNVMGARWVGSGEPGTERVLTLGGPSGTRDVTMTLGFTRPVAPTNPAVEILDDGVVYVDLNRAEWGEIERNLETLAAAPGVVFDVRRYPTGAAYQLLPHLLDAPCDHDWMWLPEIARPNREAWSWRGVGWALEPALPKIDGPMAWISTSKAISYAESVLGFVASHDVGTLVGEPTAGANGNVNPFVTPGGYRITWTGMRVTTHEGSVQHVVGVRPTVPVSLTIDDVRAGTDPWREAALADVRRRAR